VSLSNHVALAPGPVVGTMTATRDSSITTQYES